MSKSERLLAWILTGFILLALSWAYVNVDDGVRNARFDKQAALQNQIDAIDGARADRKRQLGLRERLSSNAVDESEYAIDSAKEARDTARERYRTELDTGTNSAKLKLAYRKSELRVTAAEQRSRSLKSDRTVALAKAKLFAASNATERRGLEKKLRANRRAETRMIFFLRALLAFGILGLSLFLMRKVAERSPRLLPLAQAAVGASALLALTMIIDYSEVSFDFETFGPLGLSLLGALLTIAGFFALQRYMRKRLPAKRLRSNECRSCGYPAGQSNFCEGCGEQVLEVCPSCDKTRRVGTAHCRACGAAL